MTECPKCGSRRISGPRYVGRSVVLLRNALRYTCGVCGYMKDTPCRDARAAAVPLEEHTP